MVSYTFEDKHIHNTIIMVDDNNKRKAKEAFDGCLQNKNKSMLELTSMDMINSGNRNTIYFAFLEYLRSEDYNNLICI